MCLSLKNFKSSQKSVQVFFFFFDMTIKGKNKITKHAFPKHCLTNTFMNKGNIEHAITNIYLHEKWLVSLARKTNYHICAISHLLIYIEKVQKIVVYYYYYYYNHKFSEVNIAENTIMFIWDKRSFLSRKCLIKILE